MDIPCSRCHLDLARLRAHSAFAILLALPPLLLIGLVLRFIDGLLEKSLSSLSLSL
jgi:hypothetical protein